nr:OBP33pep like protein [Ipomoea batatas]
MLKKSHSSFFDLLSSCNSTRIFLLRSSHDTPSSNRGNYRMDGEIDEAYGPYTDRRQVTQVGHAPKFEGLGTQSCFATLEGLEETNVDHGQDNIPRTAALQQTDDALPRIKMNGKGIQRSPVQGNAGSHRKARGEESSQQVQFNNQDRFQEGNYAGYQMAHWGGSQPAYRGGSNQPIAEEIEGGMVGANLLTVQLQSRSIQSSEAQIMAKTFRPRLFPMRMDRISPACRQPRNPSMGFTSESFSILEYTSSSLIPVSAVSSFTICLRSPSGKNSWSGGSSSRIVTDKKLKKSEVVKVRGEVPSIARKIPAKSDL